MKLMQYAHEGRNLSKTASIIFFLLIAIILFSVSFGYFVTNQDTQTVFLFLGGMLIFGFSFMNKVWALYFIIFAMVFSPDVEVTKVAQSARNVSIRVEDIIIIIIMCGWFANIAIDKAKTLIKSTPLNIPIMLYSFILVFATLLGTIDSHVNIIKGSFFVLKMVEYFVLFFLVVNTPLNYKQIRNMVYVHLFTSFVLGIYGLSRVGVEDRISTPFEDKSEPSTMGGVLVLSLSITLAFLAHYKGLINKIFFGVFSVMLFIPLLYTLSRSSFLAFAISYCVITFLSRKKGIIFLLLIGFVCLIILFMPEVVLERITYTFQGTLQTGIKIGSVVLEESAALRIKSYIKVLNWIRKSPLFGFGVTGVGFIDGQYFRVLGETGIIGFLLFLFLQYSILRMSFMILRTCKSEFTKVLVIGYIAGHIGLLGHAVSSNTFIIIRIMELFWFMAGLLFHLYEKDDEFSEAEDFEINSDKYFRDKKDIDTPVKKFNLSHI